MTSTAVTIDAARLWQRHMDMARIGGTPKGGVNRLALTGEDIAAHRIIADWAQARGFRVFLDDMGNMFVRREGTDPTLAPSMSGSHTDTQPTGGRFDGISGVLAAFEALEAIDDAGIATRRPIEAAVWNNEEGARFAPGVMGSAVYCGRADLAAMLAGTDPDGVTMGACVAALKAAIPEAEHRALGTPIAGFIELHIEQGPILEETGNVIGVVTGMQGNRRFIVEVEGEDAHSGTTPVGRRKDAFVAATDMARALRDLFHDPEDVVRFTIGRFEVFPGATVVVPGRAVFSVDFRHPSAETLKRLGDRVEAVCRSHAGPCRVTVREPSNAAPIDFPDTMLSAIERSATARAYPQMRIYSAAGHDARYLHTLCPSGMVFVPCERGLSHNEAENAKPEDLAAGTQVICDVLLEMAERP
ncbi:MAG: Zn-dependent hydrolase [Alphaproteobacteria bacterium]